MKKIIFCLIAVFAFLPAFIEAVDKTFEIKTDNGEKYSIECSYESTFYPPSYSIFRIKNDNYNLTIMTVPDYCENIEKYYEKYSVEKVKNGFTVLYDKTERIKFIYDLEKKMWTIALYGANSTSKYSVEFSIIESNNKISFNDIYRWGEGNSNNKKIFSNMKVTYDNEQCGVPFSAYCNMAEMRSYHIYPTMDGFGFVINGGESDTIEHYTAKLIFKKGLLIRKELKD